MWNLSRPDWQDRIRAGQSLMPELPLFREEADIAVAFYNRLRLPDVPGNPTMAEASGDWFREIVAAVFGSRDPQTNTRFIEEILALLAKKNSKTTNGAALMVVALLMNLRPLAEFMFIGPTQAISDLAFSQAAGMIRLDSELDKRFKIRDHTKEIEDRLEGAKLKVKTFDANVLTGPRPAGVLLDEVHLLGKNAHATKVIRQIRGGRQATPEGFFVMLTTQSDEAPAGVFREELQTARAIRDGRIPGTMLPILYEFPDDIVQPPAPGEKPQWYDRRLWPMVLPNLDRSLNLDRLSRDFETEQTKGDAAIRVWASQHLNIQIGISLKSDAWAAAQYWEAAGEVKITLEYILEVCDVAVAGIDGGGLDDLLGLAILGRHAVTREWLLWTRAWANEKVLERRKSEAPKLLDLKQANELEIVNEPDADIKQAVGFVKQVEDAGILHQVGLDPMGVGAIVDALAEEEIEGDDRIVGVPQGWKLNGAIKTTERKIVDGTMKHGGQLLMDWAVGNAKAQERGNAVTIEKQTSGTAKIDPLIATFIAVALMSRNPPSQRSVFEALGKKASEQSGAEEAQSDDIDYQILADPRHPRFQEMKKRWEAMRDAEDEDED